MFDNIVTEMDSSTKSFVSQRQTSHSSPRFELPGDSNVGME